MMLGCEALYLDCNSLLAIMTLKIKGRSISEMAKNLLLGKSNENNSENFQNQLFQKSEIKTFKNPRNI